jgi:hypothetical protein
MSADFAHRLSAMGSEPQCPLWSKRTFCNVLRVSALPPNSGHQNWPAFGWCNSSGRMHCDGGHRLTLRIELACTLPNRSELNAEAVRCARYSLPLSLSWS